MPHTARLLVIDPQNDFMDCEGAALPVAGATADMQRTAALVDALGAGLADIVVTLDSHANYGIERTTFWTDAQGRPAPPFTEITAAACAAGRWRPRAAGRPGHEGLAAEVLGYLQALESGGRHTLMVWPVHCVLGTWGHNIAPPLAAALARWEERHSRVVERVLKGRNPLTEQYSALRAEVPRADDPATGMHQALLARLVAGALPLLVAGEASSHCVAATMEDAFAHMVPDQLARTVVLTDAMSPVAGFEAAAQTFLERARARGVQLMDTAEAARRFAAG